MIDDEIVTEVEFSESTNEYRWVPIKLSNGKLIEKKPNSIATLNEIAIKNESDFAHIEQSLKKLLEDDQLVKLAERAIASKEEHARRVVGTLALVSSDIVDLYASRR